LHRFAFEPETQLAERRVESATQRQDWRSSFGTVAVPNHVKKDISKRRIPVVTMLPPSGGAEVHFHVTRARRVVSHLQYCGVKVRPPFGAAETRMKHPDAFSVQGLEVIAAEALMLPDGLNQAFRWRIMIIAQVFF